MRLISHERSINIDTFEPELRLTLALSFETLFDGNTFLGPDEFAQILGQEFVAICNKALEEYRPTEVPTNEDQRNVSFSDICS